MLVETVEKQVIIVSVSVQSSGYTVTMSMACRCHVLYPSPEMICLPQYAVGTMLETKLSESPKGARNCFLFHRHPALAPRWVLKIEETQETQGLGRHRAKRDFFF